MISARCSALRQGGFTTRRSLFAGALALVAGWGGTPAADARKKHKKKHKKRKRSRTKTCAMAGQSPIKGLCCTGTVSVDGVCQSCDVCASGCRFATVQGAIDAAKAGDTIAVCPGTYTENLAIARDVRLVGRGDPSGVSATTLKGTGAGPVVTVKPSLVALQRLRITGGGGMGGGIANLGATVGVTDCIVSGNADRSANGGGIYNAGAMILTGSTVSQNTSALGGGIYNDGSNAIVQLQNSQIRGNTAVNGGGIYNLDGAEILVDTASRVTANFAEREGGGIFAAQTTGRVELLSRDNVTANTPTNCGGAPVDFCSGT